MHLQPFGHPTLILLIIYHTCSEVVYRVPFSYRRRAWIMNRNSLLILSSKAPMVQASLQ